MSAWCTRKNPPKSLYSPPKYPTTDYTDYMTWYQKRNYDVLNADAEAAD